MSSTSNRGPWFIGDIAEKSVLERFANEVIAKSGRMYSIDINRILFLNPFRLFVLGLVLLMRISAFANEYKCSGSTRHIAHYAPKGYCRLGLAGYGRFLDYSFGRTNTCDNTAYEVLGGHEKFLCVTSSIVHISKRFDVATLCHDIKSRRLFRISVSCTFPGGMSIADRIKFIRGISRDCDYRYKIQVPVPSYSDVNAVLENRHGEWSIDREDSFFLISFTLSLIDDNSMRFKMTIESKQVRDPSVIHSSDFKDVEVKVEGL